MNRQKFLLRMFGAMLPVALLVGCGVPAMMPTPVSPSPISVSAPVTMTTDDPSMPIVIDTDMSLDDVMAILYLLQRPDVKVKAITVSGTGHVHCGPGTQHALGLIAIAGAQNIPVACGREKPLQGDHAFPRDWREGADSTLGLTWPAGGTVAAQPAAELLASIIKSSPQKVKIVTLGPLTNLAEALQSDPKLVDNIQQIVVMGGAVDVPGNVTGVPLSAPNRTAEFNIFLDPHAANIVLKSGAAITLVPLDATNHAPIAPYFYKVLKDNHTTSAATVVYDLFKANPQIYQSGTYYWWDPVAVVIATDEGLATFETKKLSVVEVEGADVGRTQVANDGAEVRVAMTVGTERFEQVFLSTLNGGQAVTIDRTVVLPEPNVTVTFAQDKCAVNAKQPLPPGQIGIEWIVQD
ncbi:MAG TPA: nucleoside hydrolase, partial [Aggregatilineales bacterium]|nr:nucleoside hydrolase [Aggregatilineales bacterium]